MMTDAEAVVQDRAGRYGHPRENFRTIADVWTTLLWRITDEHVGYVFKPQDVGLFMAAVKLARQANKHGADNLTDLAGYARCIGMIMEDDNAQEA